MKNACHYLCLQSAANPAEEEFEQWVINIDTIKSNGNVPNVGNSNQDTG